MTRHQVELGDMAQVVRSLTAFNSFHADLLARVLTEASSTQQVWSGSAQAAFLEQYERWSEAAERMAATAVQIQQIAANAHGQYDAAATMNRAVWS